jgi:hypothetical protein
MNLSYVVLHKAKVPMYPQQHTTTINDSNVGGLPLMRLRHRVRKLGHLPLVLTPRVSAVRSCDVYAAKHSDNTGDMYVQTHPGIQVVGPVQPVPPHWPVARGLALEVVDVLVVVGVVVVVVVVEVVVELVLFFELVVVVEVVPLPPLLPLTMWLTWLTIATIWTPKDIEDDSNQHDDPLGE